VGIAKHDLGTLNASIAIEYLVGAVWTAFPGAGIIQPADNTPILLLTALTRVDGVRVRITNADDEPTVSIIMAGLADEWPRPFVWTGQPITEGDRIGFENTRSVTNNWLGRSVVTDGLQFGADMNNVTEAWRQTAFQSFKDYANGEDAAFFIALRPLDYPDELAYAWATNVVTASRAMPNKRISTSVSLQCQGLRQGDQSGPPPSFISNAPVILTRLTEAFSQDLSGNLYRFGVDVPRKTNRGWSIAGAARREHGEAPTNGRQSGAATLTTLPVEGLFNPMRVASGGAIWHRRIVGSFAVTTAPVYVRFRVRAGTSGRIFINVRNGTAGTEDQVGVDLPFSGNPTFGTNSGVVSAFVIKTLPNGDIDATFTWTPNANGAAANIGIGPGSAVTGEYIDIIGMQATTAFSEWIMGGAGTKAIAADIMSLNLTGLDMSAGFMLKMVGNVDATERVSADRFYQADDGSNSNRFISFINPANGFTLCQQLSGDVFQGSSTLRNSALIPPVAFSLVGAHGTNYIGGAVNGVVATPDTAASFITPNRLFIGSNGDLVNLPMTLSRIELVPGAPTTALVTELAG